ncbi:putative signal recognition particle 19 kDa protein-like [Capsicum annuum]|uniref:protein GFS12 isoform X1 n=1 Tax=Capsicum annuum TaxID=4072 RepID=UPI0007BFC79F|nr:protein GFS12 isoform X1 [Capsicum annuum]KAF3641023.1 putative signal recognition particle 19 kDa protein-like [Capsicum annuum]
MGREMCFECLQRRIESDLCDQLIFSYGLSDSPFPFGSTAVVQPSSSNGEGSPQFMLTYMTLHKDGCLANYIDQHYLEDLEARTNSGSGCAVPVATDQVKAEVSVGLSSDKTSSLETRLSECEDLQNGGRHKSLYGLGCQNVTCNFSGTFSCFRTLPALAPVARIGISSSSLVEGIVSEFLAGSLEDHILNSLTLMIEGKRSGRESVNFLSLVGIPSFGEEQLPGCIRHPNISPTLGMLKNSSQLNLLLPKMPHTLENILHFSPDALKSDWHMRYLLFQILSGLAYMHGLGVSHGNVHPSSISLVDSLWCWLPICSKFLQSSVSISKIEDSPDSEVSCCFDGCPLQGLYADLKLYQSTDWYSIFKRWWRGEISNFEYLLILNQLAGRRWGDNTFYIVMPWVIDFSVKPDENNDTGWRDLTKSKWRLAKGDEQLDFTYSTSEIPHHISDECLSELAVCSYKARRLPLTVLKMAVRSVYEPNEYPSTMQRLYQWTPDECIPEFYCDPRIFYSVHSGMSDLAVPSWAGTPEEFVKLHRDAFESDRVSHQLHHWIDITFGYKLCGDAAVAAKNVMLPSSAPTIPKSVGRRQLFTKPHPRRQLATLGVCDKISEAEMFPTTDVTELALAFETSFLHELEEAAVFSEHAPHLNPIYNLHPDVHKELDSPGKGRSTKTLENITSRKTGSSTNTVMPSIIDVNYLLKNIEVGDAVSAGYQALLLWKPKFYRSHIYSEDVANDIFAVGCILAELHLRRPLFDPASLAVYLESGVLPALVHELPPDTQVVVESCIQKDWRRRPTAKCLLDSPYFLATIKSSYLFLAPLQLIAKDESRLRYAAAFARQGALKAMGTFAAEMCAPNCLKLVLNPLSDSEAEWGCIVLTEFLRCLNPEAVKMLVIPAIQKILQGIGPSHLKVSLLQGSFVLDIWDKIGKQAYVETIHPFVVLNLHGTPCKNSAAAASVLLIGSSEELGIPITVHQTILPLLHCFGKGLSDDGIDVLVRIGILFGEDFIVKQILPLLRIVILSCIDNAFANKHETAQSWSTLALIDTLMTLDGLTASLTKEVLVKELVEDNKFLYLQVLMQTNIGIQVVEGAARNLLALCQQIGSDLTVLHVLPKLKQLFDELAFSQEKAGYSSIQGGSLRGPNAKGEDKNKITNRLDLVMLLYPSFASLLGIEKLRQGCATWLLLEQFLLRHYNWKWESTGESSRSGPSSLYARKPTRGESLTSEHTPDKMLLNGLGWSTPQSQGKRGAKPPTVIRNVSSQHQDSADKNARGSDFSKIDPWYWFPSPAANWSGPDFIGRPGGSKDELPWKIKASVLHSVRAHQGVLRSIVVCQDECNLFTAGVAPGFKGTVQKWELSRFDSVSGYYGHEEVVNDISLLASSGRVASCDGTVHVWNGQTGKLITVFAEFSTSAGHHTSSLPKASKLNLEQANMLHFNPLSGGILNTDGNLYTSMYYSEYLDNIVVGTGNGSLRFIDVRQGQKLHLWRSEATESNFPSLISSICSCAATKQQYGNTQYPSWVAVGQSSGYCRLFDVRSGKIISSWQAHDGFVTKIATPEEHLLVSSSLDRTLRIWDLRRNWKSIPLASRGHTDAVSDFSIWGQNVISIFRSKIGLSSLASSPDEDGQQFVTPQYLYMGDRESKNVSVLSSINVLPFSRLFVVGTEDGHLKICC